MCNNKSETESSAPREGVRTSAERIRKGFHLQTVTGQNRKYLKCSVSVEGGPRETRVTRVINKSFIVKKSNRRDEAPFTFNIV